MTRVYTPDMSCKKLVVDYQALGNLAQLFDEEGVEIPKILRSTWRDMEQLGEGDEGWKGANYDAFMAYFKGLYDDVMNFHDYVRYFGELMHEVIAEYHTLETDIDAKVAGALDACH